MLPAPRQGAGPGGRRSAHHVDPLGVDHEPAFDRPDLARDHDLCHRSEAARAVDSGEELPLGGDFADRARVGPAPEGAAPSLARGSAEPAPLALAPVGARAAAEAVIRIANTHMAGAIRMVSISMGADPRDFALFAFGGAGPVHACHVAELLESTTVIYPPLASVLSAFGTLVTPVRFDLARGTAGGIDWEQAAKTYSEMASEAGIALKAAGCAPEDINYVYGADMRYAGQQNEVTIEFDGDPTGFYDELHPATRNCDKMLAVIGRQLGERPR